MSAFSVEKLLVDVFAPRPGESAVVTVDVPHDAIADHADWQARRRMAEAWRSAFGKLGLNTPPLVAYPATGSHNADLPAFGRMDERRVAVRDTLAASNVIVAMTEFSATAPLVSLVREFEHLRAASMPGVLRRMETTALAADYREVARKVHRLAERLTRAERAQVVFSSGHEAVFDLRYRAGIGEDDGMCHPGKKLVPIVNLPSGEAFIVPYEGERSGEPSRTAGRIPVVSEEGELVLRVERNRVVSVDGAGGVAGRWRHYFREDPARSNVAELGLGCNDRAVVQGNVLEDEKAGLHWAYGRSEHLGGTVGPGAFRGPEYVVHEDIVYAKGCPIGVRELVLHYRGGGSERIMRDSEYVIAEF